MRRRTRFAALGGLATASVVVVVATGGVGYVVATAPAPPPTVSVTEIRATIGTADLNWPAGVQAGAFNIEGIEGAHGTTGTPEALPMASIAKLLAMLVVLDVRPLAQDQPGPVIDIGPADVQHLRMGMSQGASVLPVAAGDRLTQRQLIEASMLISAANAAETLTAWAFGSREAYVAAASAWLEDRGIVGITPVDASGLDGRGTASATALLDLMAEADGDPTLRAILGQRSTDLPRLGTATSTNGALGLAGIDAGKTGSLNRSGQTIVVGATRVVGGVELRLHAALLGIDRTVDRDAAIASLVESALRNVALRELVPASVLVAEYETEWGTEASLSTAEPVILLHWAGTPVDVTVRVDDAAPGSYPSGTLSVETGPGAQLSPLQPTGSLEPPGLRWRLLHAKAVLNWD